MSPNTVTANPPTGMGSAIVGETKPIVHGGKVAPVHPHLIDANKAVTPVSGLVAEYTEPYVLAVDPAIYMCEIGLSAAVFVNHRLMDLCKDWFSMEPELGVPFTLASELCAHCVEQQVKLFGLWIPGVRKPAPIVRELVEFEEEALKEAMELEVESLERSMDIAIGAI